MKRRSESTSGASPGQVKQGQANQGQAKRLLRDASGQPQYKPAGQHERLALLDASVDAIQRLPYLKIVATSEADDEKEMIRLQCKADGRVAAELMQSAIRAVWKSHVVRGKTSLHITRITESGFDFRFTLLEHGVFSTGIYTVELGAASPEAVIETGNY